MMDRQEIDKSAWQHYWKMHPDKFMADCSRPNEVIAFRAGAEWAQAAGIVNIYSPLNAQQEQETIKTAPGSLPGIKQ